MNEVILGALINSGLYLISVFVAGIIWQNHTAVILAIAAMGVTYLSYFIQIIPSPPKIFVLIFVGLSIVIGGGAGITLLLGI